LQGYLFSSFEWGEGVEPLSRHACMVNELTQKTDLSQKGEKGILEATYILRCMLLVQETYPRRRRDNIVYMFACNTPST
jgi:hypothetical protein